MYIANTLTNTQTTNIIIISRWQFVKNKIQCCVLFTKCNVYVLHKTFDVLSGFCVIPYILYPLYCPFSTSLDLFFYFRYIGKCSLSLKRLRLS